MTFSREQELARLQLEEIAARSDGALEIISEPDQTDAGALRVHLSIATRDYRRAGGLAFRDRERFVVLVGDGFPFTAPTIFFGQARFAGTPHVQWGRYICLYQSQDAEWSPGDGMFGFMDRVDTWLAAAGEGTLDPDDAPLHPPVAYAASNVSVVVRIDAPASDDLWIGRADLKRITSHRLDLVGWTALDDWGDAPGEGLPAVAILLAKPMPIEYPTGVNDLIKALEAVGVPFALIWPALRLAAGLAPAGEPGHIVLGAPMRRRGAGEPLRQHLTVWEIAVADLQTLRDYIAGGDGKDEKRNKVAEWMVTAKVGWCRVLEDRPEIVNRRDVGTHAAGIAGQQVALLGCGALGSAIAEMLVRAGVAKLRLVDKGIVTPGLLIRQRFTDGEIGRSKARALKERLDKLGLGCEIDTELVDLRHGALKRLDGLALDLVIDASASRAVAHRLDMELETQALNCPLIRVAVSAEAAHGSVAVRMPAYCGGPTALDRAAKLAAFRRDRDHPLVRAFWPDQPAKMILPEPGCSSPTFVGSAADVDHHAAGLLNIGLAQAAALAPDAASMDLCASIWSSLLGKFERRLSYEFSSLAVTREHNRGYAVLTSAAAERDMAAEMRRIARVRSSKVETGGLIFGEIDDSHQRIWIDAVSGPPPDSEQSPEAFLCGTAGTVALTERHRKASAGSSRFVGIWHTHPVSRGSPSNEDMRAMVQLLHLQPNPPRQVVMLIIGFAERHPQPNHYLFHRNDFRLVRFELGAPPNGDDHG